MAIQQLDLFGNPVTIPIIKEEPAKVQPVKKQEATVEDNTPKSFPLFEEKSPKDTTGITVIPARTVDNEKTVDIENQEEAENEVVYSDDQIRVKLKLGRPKKILTKAEEAEKAAGGSVKSSRKPFSDTEGYPELTNVPSDEILNKKMYYKIAIVAEWFGVNKSMIRYWEKEFDILKPRLTRKGDRLFRVEDVKNLQIIYQLLKIRKFSIEGAKAYLKQNKQKADVHMELTESLTKIRTFLVDLKTTLNV